MNDKADFSKIIKKLRKSAGLSQIDLSKIINKDQATVSRIEKGTQIPNLETIFNLADFFGINAQDLLIGEINFWAIAEKFGSTLEIDSRYLSNKNSVLREVIPLMKFIVKSRGAESLHKFLDSFGLKDLVYMSPNDYISSFIYFDLMAGAIDQELFNKKDYRELIRMTESAEYHDQFFNIYKSHLDPFDIIKTYSLNGPAYGGSLISAISSEKENAMTISFKIREELKDIDYSKNGLSDLLIALKEHQVESLPQYFCRRSILVKSKKVKPQNFSNGFDFKLIRAA